VLRTDGPSIERVADGLQPRVAMTLYNEMDGMANSQANGSSAPTAVVRDDGTLWVATAGGVATVDPTRLQWFRERPSPPVVIDEVEQDGLPLSWRDAPSLSLEGGHRLSVSYVGLSYLLPERTEYRTRLDGLDTDWVNRGRQRSVEFIRLPPGSYTLHVAAAHPDGPWSNREAVLHFTIQPLLWQRHSVQLAALLMLGVLLFWLYRYRTHRYRTRAIRLAGLVDERTRDLQVQAQQLRDANQEKTGLLHQLRLQSEAFERQAREDVLTGLPNRRALDERLEQEIARARRSAQPLCMAMLDVDHFKKVNDQYSHGVGDVVLKQVGSLLVGHARDADMAARSGGEEFCLVFIDTSLEQAGQACARLHALFHAQAGWGGIATLQISFSAGLVQLEGTDVSPASLYQRADRLLYRAKRNGRDRTEHD
jgi:diguanylate cyclase (GGDEF)-like protein